jgi:hypothetical protein
MDAIWMFEALEVNVRVPRCAHRFLIGLEQWLRDTGFLTGRQWARLTEIFAQYYGR